MTVLDNSLDLLLRSIWEQEGVVRRVDGVETKDAERRGVYLLQRDLLESGIRICGYNNLTLGS